MNFGTFFFSEIFSSTKVRLNPKGSCVSILVSNLTQMVYECHCTSGDSILEIINKITKRGFRVYKKYKYFLSDQKVFLWF
jgi:hypothetical protein